MHEAVLQADALEFAYPNHPPVLCGLSLSIAAGERVALLGPNGAGKSTLLTLMAGLAKPTAGRMLVLGRETRDPALRARVGLVFQDPDDQLFCPTLEDDVAFGPRNLGLDAHEVERRVETALVAVELWQQRHRAPHHLSLGQRKRAALATVLAMRPEILLLDEPSAHLDAPSRADLLALLVKLGGTQVIVTQDPGFAVGLATRALVLEEGLVLASVPASELSTDPRTRRWLGLMAGTTCPGCGRPTGDER